METEGKTKRENIKNERERENLENEREREMKTKTSKKIERERMNRGRKYSFE